MDIREERTDESERRKGAGRRRSPAGPPAPRPRLTVDELVFGFAPHELRPGKLWIYPGVLPPHRAAEEPR